MESPYLEHPPTLLFSLPGYDRNNSMAILSAVAAPSSWNSLRNSRFAALDLGVTKESRIFGDDRIQHVER